MSSKNEKIGIYSLILIFLFGSFIRFYRLGYQALWFDEIHSWFMASKGIMHLWQHQITSSYPPVYFSFLNVWIRIFGKSAFALRFPSAILGIVSILVVYYCSRRMFGKKTAILSSLLVSLSCHHLYYSQEARAYMALSIASLLSGYFFWQMLINKDSKQINVLYIISTLLCLYLHNYGIFIWFAQVCYLLVTGRFKDRRMWLAQFCIALSYAPRALILWQQIPLDMNAYILPPTMRNIVSTFEHYVLVSRHLPEFPVIKALIILNCMIYFGGIVLALIKIKRNNVSLTICLLHIIVPLGAALLVSYLVKPIYVAGRYDIISYYFFIMLTSYGLTCLPWKKIFSGLITVIILSSLACQYDYFFIYNKSNNRKLNTYIKETVNKDDVLVFTNLAVLAYHYAFGWQSHKSVFAYPEGEDIPCHPKELIEGDEVYIKNQIALLDGKIEKTLTDANKLYLFYNVVIKADTELFDYLKDRLSFKEEISFHKRSFDHFEIMRVSVWEKKA